MRVYASAAHEYTRLVSNEHVEKQSKVHETRGRKSKVKRSSDRLKTVRRSDESDVRKKEGNSNMKLKQKQNNKERYRENTSKTRYPIRDKKENEKIEENDEEPIVVNRKIKGVRTPYYLCPYYNFSKRSQGAIYNHMCKVHNHEKLYCSKCSFSSGNPHSFHLHFDRRHK